MGKKRKTAKTGDKKLYKGRELTVSTKNKGDDDNMYNEIDRYHNQKEEEYIRLNQQPDEHIDDDGYADKEAVLDLAGGVSSSEDEDEVDSGDESVQDVNIDDDDDDEPATSSDDDDDDEEMDEEAVTDWGRKKASYFGGDTADLEIGQDEEDAYLEEEAAKEVQNARYENMDEDDFVLSDNEDEIQQSRRNDGETLQSSRDLKKLSNAAKRKLLQSHHPELIPLVTHFSNVVTDWHERTRVVADALFSSKDVSPKDVGATNMGLEYLLTKSMLQASSALNVAAYLLLKAEHAQKEKESGDSFFEVDASAAIKSHPVIARLQQLNKLGMKLEDTVESKIDGIDEQINSLVKAAALMKNGAVSDDDDDDDDDDEDSENPDLASESDGDEVTQKKPRRPTASSDDDARDRDMSDQEIAHGVLNEARFGLRVKEITSKAVPQQRRPAPSDFGDEVEDSSKARKASQALASTVNAIQQRSSAKARKSSRHDEDLDKQGGDDDRVSRGIAMMEAELGPLDDDEDDDDGSGGDEIDDELDDDLGNGSFYDQIKKKSQVQKAFKKQLHAVAPKFPVMEGVVDGERAISKVILKNRGLVAHKAKINRNPRVKHREKFRKAKIRLRGKIREVRTDEGHKYGGEGTGIKTGLSRSRKLGAS